MNTRLFGLSAGVFALIGAGAYAQTTAFDLETAAADEVEDLQEQIEDDAERDLIQSNVGREVGAQGSFALRFSQNSDEDGEDTTSLGLGLSYLYFDGVNGYDAVLSYVYEESDGEEDTNRLTGSVGYTRDFATNFFGYVDGTVRIDELAEGDEIERDAFLGLGAGYRVIDSPVSQWTVRAGPGYRFIEPAVGEEVDETAYSVESNYSRVLYDGVVLTNDTQLIGSDFDTTISNDLAVSVAVSSALALRTSYVVEWGGDDFDSLDQTSSTLGASIVYSFN